MADIIAMIEERAVDHVSEHETQLVNFVERLNFLRSTTVPHMPSNGGQAIPAFLLTLASIKRGLEPILRSNSLADYAVAQREVLRKLRALEKRIDELNPRAEIIASMVETIVSAHAVADQLPEDLATLAEGRRTLAEIVRESKGSHDKLQAYQTDGEKLHDKLSESLVHAETVLERCGTAYSADTSKGLAAAFAARSVGLTVSMRLWVGGLVAALAVGAYVGTSQLGALVTLVLSPQAGPTYIALNAVVAIFSVATPVWFAWLATKQIGQRFKLAEDYAFKASVSQAYEGFRKEAERIDPDMQQRLLASALARLDEQPLRVMAQEVPGSPWHDLFASDTVRRAMEQVPDFSARVRDIAAHATTRPVQATIVDQKSP